MNCFLPPEVGFVADAIRVTAGTLLAVNYHIVLAWLIANSILVIY